MDLKDYSDNEAVRSRGQELVSISPPSFSDVKRARRLSDVRTPRI